MSACRRVTMTHVPVENGTVTLENSFSALGEILYFIIFIHKSHVERHRIENGHKFFH